MASSPQMERHGLGGCIEIIPMGPQAGGYGHFLTEEQVAEVRVIRHLRYDMARGEVEAGCPQRGGEGLRCYRTLETGCLT